MTILQWLDGNLLIENPTPQLKQLLTYQHKSLVQNEGERDRKTVKELVQLWANVPDRPDAIITYQGLIDEVTAHLKSQKVPFESQDLRLKLPAPKMSLVKGFIHTQFGLFAKAVQAQRSGIIEAPTRYGKTAMVVNFCRAYPGLNTVITAPGIDLLTQLYTAVKEQLPTRDVKGLWTGHKNKTASSDITVCSMDSLEKLNPECVRMILIDEIHAAATPARIPVLASFKNARFYGFGATPEGRFDGTDRVTRGLIGPVIARKTFREAVAEKAICDIHVWMVKIKFDPFKAWNRAAAYKKLIHQNAGFVGMVQELATRTIPQDWQTLIFIENEKQAQTLKAAIPESELGVAKLLNPKDRQALFKRLAAGEVKRCICTGIYAQGVTFPDIRVLINCAGGGGSITGVQKPGRLAQIRPGKKYGHMIDFLFEVDVPPPPVHQAHDGPEPAAPQEDPWVRVVSDSYARLQVYKKKGYVIHMVEDLNGIHLD